MSIEEQLRFAAHHRLGQVVVEVRVEVASGCTLSTSCRRSHCAAKRVASASARGSRASAAPAPRAPGRTACPAWRAQEFLIGRRAPEEERQARREIEVADAIDPARRRRWPGSSRAGRRSAGSPESPAARRARRRRSRPSCRALLIKRHQAIDFPRRQRAAVRVAPEARDDLTRAGPLFVRRSSGGTRRSCSRLGVIGNAGDLIRPAMISRACAAAS